MAYDNTPIQNSQYTQTRPYVGWTTCPRCHSPALLIGYLGSYGTCSNCGVWRADETFVVDDDYRSRQKNQGADKKSADSNFPKTCK